MIRGLASANPSGRWSGGSHPMGAELIVRNDDQPHTIPQDASQPVEKLAQKLLALLGECDSEAYNDSSRPLLASQQLYA